MYEPMIRWRVQHGIFDIAIVSASFFVGGYIPIINLLLVLLLPYSIKPGSSALEVYAC